MRLTSLLGLLLVCHTVPALSLSVPETGSQPEEGAAAAAETEEPPAWRLWGDFDWSISDARDSTLNLTHYGNDVTRLLRVSLSFSFRPVENTRVYVNLTSENARTPHLYGAFVRLAPWGGDKLWLQAGKIPPPFGAFPERWYPAANPLIGYPLMYQHRTSLRPDSLPRDGTDLLSQRGNGRAAQFNGGGNVFARTGMPMVSLFRWDSGLVGFGTAGLLDYVLGVTNGTLSNPRVVDENDGKQILGRLHARLSPAFDAGFSAARGPYLDRAVQEGLGDQDLEAFMQKTLGGDAHFARGHFLLYLEAVWTRWESPHLERPLDALSGFLEGRYRLRPGFYVAGRVDRVSFSGIETEDGRREPWEFPLTRLEIGAGYSWVRNVVLKFALQVNRYEGASKLDEDIAALQIALRF